MIPRFGRIRMQAIGFAGMAVGMLMLLATVGLTNSRLHSPLVFVEFILFNLLMNAGPNSTTVTLAPILSPTHFVGQLVDSPLALPNSVRPWAFPSYHSLDNSSGFRAFLELRRL